jgi:uncharacterized protein YunC (DUF1805 family)
VRFLRQSTASQEILLGPFVAAADGTPQTGLTIANTDIKLLYGGGTTENNKNSGGGTHIAGGRYSAVLDATDTATVGILEVSVNPASGIPWNKSYQVVEEAVYDAMFAASAVGPLLANSDGSGLTEAGGTGDHLTALATQASVNTIDDLLDTELPALTTAVADLPTNAELATALGTADDAVLSAIAAVSTKVDAVDDLLDTELPALTTAVADLPTNAELATALAAADDAVLAQVALVKTNTDKFANLPVLTAAGTGGQGYGAP